MVLVQAILLEILGVLFGLDNYSNDLILVRNKGMWKYCYFEIFEYQVFNFVKGFDC